jgi:phenylalanyl-tRNA synthetase beta chain
MPVAGDGQSPVTVTIEAPDLCPGFALRAVKGVTNGPSPKWLQQRLIAIGLRPINALVDITNYITFDRGRPLHVFDAAKVTGDLVVRRARDGEKVLALDGREYALNPDTCVIADDNGVESIAGVMGGEHSGCDENTTEVLIESALWEPLNVARTGRDLGIITDARYRFERGVDPEFMVPGLELATHMVTQLCGGEPSEIEVVGYEGHTPKTVAFPVSEVERLTGLAVLASESLAILGRLGFKPLGDGETVDVEVPSWRPDVDGKADLVEEVMRINGVEKIAPQPLTSHDAVNGRILTVLQMRTRAARRALSVRGMLEAVTWSFIPESHAALFGGGKSGLKLANPIAADMSDMRPSLLPGLIAAAQRNAARGFADVALFEVATTYESDAPEGQRRAAAGVRRGTAHMDGQGRHWSGNAAPVGVFDAKADAIAVLEACGAPVDKLQVEAGGPDWYHPGRSGTIRLGPKIVLATFGEFHPKVLETLDASAPIAGFEVFIDAIPEPKARATRTKPRLDLSPFQAVRRDFAFVVDRAVEAQALTRAAAAADKKLITGVRVFDIFEGESVGADKKSVALEVAIQPVERTLTDEDFEALAARIVENVGKQTGGVLRS